MSTDKIQMKMRAQSKEREREKKKSINREKQGIMNESKHKQHKGSKVFRYRNLQMVKIKIRLFKMFQKIKKKHKITSKE